MARTSVRNRPSVERALVGPDRVGNDGLTDRERDRRARRYRETVMRPLSDDERRDIAAWLREKRAAATS